MSEFKSRSGQGSAVLFIDSRHQKTEFSPAIPKKNISVHEFSACLKSAYISVAPSNWKHEKNLNKQDVTLEISQKSTFIDS